MKKISKRIINLKNDYDICKNNYIGKEIRRIRLLKGLNLEELSDKCCSISYLCKVETGKIEPNKEILTEILNRLGFSSSDLKLIDKLDSVLDQIIIDAYYRKYANIEETIDKYKTMEFYRAKVVLFVGYVMLNKTAELLSIYNELSFLKYALDYDRSIIQLFLAYYHLKRQNNRKAINAISEVNVKVLNRFDYAIYMELLTKLSFYCNSTTFYDAYNISSSQAFATNNFLLFFELNFIRFLDAVMKKQMTVCDELYHLNKNSSIYIKEYDVLYLYINEYYKEIIALDANDDLTYILKILSYEKLKDTKNIVKMVQENRDFKDNTLKYRYKSYRYKYLYDVSLYKEFLLNEALKMTKILYFPVEMRRYCDLILNLEQKEFKYKNCVDLYTRCNEEIVNFDAKILTLKL